MWAMCARRSAIMAALAGAGVITLVGAKICAGAVVSVGSTCAGYVAAAWALLAAL